MSLTRTMRPPLPLVGLDDDVGEFARASLEPALDVDRVLEVLVLRRRRHADLARPSPPGSAAWMALITSVGRQAEGVELLRVQPDAHRILADAEHLDVADARQARQLVDQVDGRVVADDTGCRSGRPARSATTICRIDVDFFCDDRRPAPAPAAAARPAPRCTRFCTSTWAKFEVGADLEGHGQRVGAVVGAGRLHVDHALDAVDLQLDRQRDVCRRRSCALAPGIGRRHLHGRRHDVGILRDRQA